MNTATLSLFNPKHLVIGLAMLLAAGLAFVLTPKVKVAEQGPRIDLEKVIPKQFGDWRVDESIVPIQVSPDVQAKLDRIYNQTLSRTYINNAGERIMLSLAYGSDQSDSMQVHRPEVCYPAQGFQIMKQKRGKLAVGGQEVPVKRLVAAQGPRVEPITYWIVVGNQVTRGDTDRKLARVLLGLTGKVPDGMLVRVSSIDRNDEHAFQVHADFLNALAGALEPEKRQRLIGAAT